MRVPRKYRAKLILLIGFLRLIRFPNLLIILLTQYLVRIFLVGSKENWKNYLTDLPFFFLVLSTLLIAAAGYIINDYYDIKIDTINKPKRIVVGRILRRRMAMAVHIILNTIGILLAFSISIRIAFIVFASGFFLWLYSNQLKRLPFIGNFTIATLTAVSLIIVVVYKPESEFLVFTYAIFAFFISLIREIIKDMEDVKGDASFGCRTLPIIWGIRRTKILLYIFIATFLIVLFALSVFLHNTVVTYFCFFVLLPLGYLTLKLTRADTKKEFAYLSKLCKFIMLSGVLSMVLVR